MVTRRRGRTIQVLPLRSAGRIGLRPVDRSALVQDNAALVYLINQPQLTDIRKQLLPTQCDIRLPVSVEVGQSHRSAQVMHSPDQPTQLVGQLREQPA